MSGTANSKRMSMMKKKSGKKKRTPGGISGKRRFRIPLLCMTNRAAILILFLTVIPMTVTGILIEQGFLPPGRNFYLAIPLSLSFLLIPFSRFIAHWMINRDLMEINRFCLEIKKGNYDIYFDLGNEKEDEDSFIILFRNLTWMSRGLAVKHKNDVKRMAQARKEFSKMEKRALTDPLTGLYNRRHFKRLDLKSCFEGNTPEKCTGKTVAGKPISLVYIDCDKFKQVNDTKGHKAGDRILTELAACIRKACRLRQDTPFRMGGDEFAILLPGADADQAGRIAERIRRLYHRNEVENTSLSIGIATALPEAETGQKDWEMLKDDLVQSADRRVYDVKRTGGNSIAKGGIINCPERGHGRADTRGISFLGGLHEADAAIHERNNRRK